MIDDTTRNEDLHDDDSVEKKLADESFADESGHLTDEAFDLDDEDMDSDLDSEGEEFESLDSDDTLNGEESGSTEDAELLDLDSVEETGQFERPKKNRKAPGHVQKAKKIEEDLDEAGAALERLQKVLAAGGLASRRHCEEYILDGRVTVDGKVISSLGMKVDPDKQRICVDGERIRIQKKVYFLVNKPTGFHCTNDDPMGRRRVIDLLPPTFGRLFTVGRLDETSEGLILVSNDGELAHRLAHPRFQVERVYRALVAGKPEDETLRKLRQGLFFSDGKFRVRDVRRMKSNGRATILEVVLTEGQNREVRRMFARVGHKVMRLKRVGFGPLKLGELQSGAFRPLTLVEVRVLQNFAHSAPDRRSGSTGSRANRTGQGPRRTGRPGPRGPAARGSNPSGTRKPKMGRGFKKRR